MAAEPSADRLKTILSGFGEEEKKLIVSLEGEIKDISVPSKEDIRGINTRYGVQKLTNPNEVKEFLLKINDDPELKKLVRSIIQPPSTSPPPPPPPSMESGSEAPSGAGPLFSGSTSSGSEDSAGPYPAIGDGAITARKTRKRSRSKKRRSTQAKRRK
jgi:hypothetical protein